MRKPTYLKWLRVGVALLFFIPTFFIFLDYRGLIPAYWSKVLHIQLFPAILAGMLGIVIVQLALALLFGRIYCSSICPTGILQDIINRIYCIGKKKGSKRFKYHQPYNLLRYILLALTIGLSIFGFMELCVLLDPYSNFGRIGSNLFRPLAIFGNNILAGLLAKVDNYTLFHVSINTVTTGALIGSCIALAIFIIMVISRGRLFCNTLCPIGAFLSLLSRHSFFRIHIDQSTCVSCRACEHSCKSEAINITTFSVDNSRCVDCFNCISSCPKGSVQYKTTIFNKKSKPQRDSSSLEMEVDKRPASTSRRTFLATSATVATSLPVISAVAQTQKEKNGYGKKDRPTPITPPGSLSLNKFKDKCTGCHACIVQCPSQVLRPAGLEFGFGYLLRPHMTYIDSYCNYECTVCSEICPTHAIKPLTKEEKITTQVGVAHFFLNRCIVHTDNTDCGACSEHCPTQAVHMELYKEDSTLTIPVVEPELCIGCGGCESICPARPARAIIIKANTKHQQVEKPAEEDALEIELEGFGF